jgi:nitroreductase
MIKQFLEALNWRYATKRMTGEAVPEEKIHNILEAARLAPTSIGFQPFDIIVVKNKELLEKIAPVANNQPQIAKASHLLIFAAWTDLTAEHIHEFFDRTGSERNLPAGTLDGFKNNVLGMFGGMGQEDKDKFITQQTNIAFGFAVAAAAVEHVDATPMGGFKGPELDKLLGLDKRGLRSVVIMPVGVRDAAQDPIVNMKKIRRAKEAMVIEIDQAVA